MIWCRPRQELVAPEWSMLSPDVIGRSGYECAARASREVDPILAVGSHFSDNNTANWRKGSIYDVEKTKIVQVDMDHGEIGRNFPVALGLICDATQALSADGRVYIDMVMLRSPQKPI
jgi:thiamine pyrophosphate-dependent acetolactate synthase large subunit-like protein